MFSPGFGVTLGLNWTLAKHLLSELNSCFSLCAEWCSFFCIYSDTFKHWVTKLYCTNLWAMWKRVVPVNVHNKDYLINTVTWLSKYLGPVSACTKLENYWTYIIWIDTCLWPLVVFFLEYKWKLTKQKSKWQHSTSYKPPYIFIIGVSRRSTGASLV